MKMLLRSFGLAVLLPFVGCLSSSPPAPVVRWFDPTPRELTTPPDGMPPVRLRVVSPSHLGRELAYRIGDREYAFDVDHRWIADPAALVTAALQRGVPQATDGREIVVELERFELDVVQAPRARVQFALRTAQPAGSQRIEAVQSAATRSVDALVTAMALALVDATAQVQQHLARRETSAAAASQR